MNMTSTQEAVLHSVNPEATITARVQGSLQVAGETPGDPVETLTRFRVIRETFFDFEAQHVLMLHDEEAQVAIHYYMGSPAEEAASYQTMGFFEGLLELAGAKDIRGMFRAKSWEGDPRTILDVRWITPGS